MKYRPSPLFCLFVIIVALLALCAYFVFAIYTYQSAVAEDDVTQSVTMSRPQVCQPYYNVGRHDEWADCMGVGYK